MFQMKILLSKKEAGMPMYLDLACEELRVFGIYEKVRFCVTLRISSCLLLGIIFALLS